MKKSYIALIDSGVGGLSVLKRFVNFFPDENYLYFGDNLNAPYGNKSIRELKKIVLENIIHLNDYNIKFLVVACNTLSTNLISFIKEICPYPVFGIYPPIEFFLMKNKNVALVCTNRTALLYKKANVRLFPLKDLARDIENHLFNLSNLSVQSYIQQQFYTFDSVILGCTHYFFIKSEFFNHFNHSNICCSEDFVFAFFYPLLKHLKSIGNIKRFSILFIGKNKEINKIFWKKVVKNLKI